MGTPASASGTARFSGVCPPNCTMTPSGFSRLDDVEHVFERERLEVEAVGGVVVGRDRLGVGVDHDGLVAQFAQRERGVDAAVVELDALADAVGPPPRIMTFGLSLGRLSSSRLVGRVVVGRVGLELGRAGVHQLVDRLDADLHAQPPHAALVDARQLGDLGVGEAVALGLAQQVERHRALVAGGGDALLHLDDLAHVVEEPGVDLRQVGDVGDGHAVLEGVLHVEEAVGVRPGELGAQLLRLDALLADAVQAAEADLQPAQALLQRLLEGAADGHRLADGLHRAVSVSSAPGNFSKAQRGILTTQ